MGSGFAKQKKQAKLLQAQMMQMQSQMQQTEATGSAGNGLVSITLSGEHEMKSIKIKPECVDPEDIEGLEVLVKAAYADACKKLQEQGPKLGGGAGGMPDLSAFGL